MNILGIGPLELVLILIIAILVLGPQQMVVTARKAGALVRKVVKSPIWGTIMDTSREIRDIPTKLVREAGLDEDIKDIQSTAQSIRDLKNISVTTNPITINSDINKKSTEPEKQQEPVEKQEKIIGNLEENSILPGQSAPVEAESNSKISESPSSESQK
ncbi:MAG: hypothetical protein ACYDH1_09800 [Anaerolineaceae bacterium]